jgi:dihydropyrimidinase
VGSNFDLVVKDGLVVTPAGTLRADVAIAGERIAAIGVELDGGARELDARGMYVIPGAVDGHVHLTDPTFPPFALPTADSFTTGTIAAACGGTTTVVDFAQPAAGEPLVAELERRRTDADGAVIDYALHLNVRDPHAARVREIADVVARGVPTFKLYMAYDGYRLPDAAILRVMTAVAAQRGLVVIHAENDDVIGVLSGRLADEGRSGPAWLAAACPPAAEAEAVHRAIMLAEVAGARLLVFHLSCREAERELAWAKRRGRPVAGEVTSHALTIDHARLEAGDALAQSLAVRPPIRDAAQRQALWAALAAGTIDIVSSDHCPRTPLAHGQPAGVSGIECRLALVHEFGVRSGLIDLARWVEVCCARPAALLGLDRKGRLEPGADADVVLFDPARAVALSATTLHSALPFASYEGVTVRGFPVTTISRGEVIVEGGAFVGVPGRGRFVERGW